MYYMLYSLKETFRNMYVYYYKLYGNEKLNAIMALYIYTYIS